MLRLSIGVNMFSREARKNYGMLPKNLRCPSSVFKISLDKTMTNLTWHWWSFHNKQELGQCPHQRCRDFAGCDRQSLFLNEEGTNLHHVYSNSAILLSLSVPYLVLLLCLPWWKQACRCGLIVEGWLMRQGQVLP